ncbi:MAG: hypothetical protein GXP29_05175 [Planctomycetes bacterium]|nr:hypothetical protein [Planctomycetota bacterium]
MLAGFLARTYDVERKDGFTQAQISFDESLETGARVDRRRHPTHPQYRSAKQRHHLLLAVWMMEYRYANKAYQVVVNAATAEVQGDRPYSAVKIAFAVVCGLVVVGGIVYIASQK